MSSSIRVLPLVILASALAAMTIGCSPPGAVNEKAVLDSTPHSEPAEYATSPEAYNQHMADRYTKGKAKSMPGAAKSRKAVK
jgi:hypothetical protein